MEFPNLGKHCKMEFCNKLDFLPITCDSCKETFCTDHFSYVNHNCSVASRKDNQVPVCPLCFNPVPSEKGREDYAVSQHIDKFCNTQTKIYTNNCSFKNCKKKELVKITCNSCKRDFCLKHRHENVHKCSGPINSQRNIMAEAALKRLEQASQNGSHEYFSKIQGTMSEDEALAKAIHESMLTNRQTATTTAGGAGDSNANNKNCAIS